MSDNPRCINCKPPGTNHIKSDHAQMKDGTWKCWGCDCTQFQAADTPNRPADEPGLDDADKVIHALWTNGEYSTKLEPAEAKAALLRWHTAEVRKAELYGRLHETIEQFQAGRISANQYSERHAELTEKLQEENLDDQ